LYMLAYRFPINSLCLKLILFIATQGNEYNATERGCKYNLRQTLC
jgi:hypothetical protein